jgi:hypothetical protein
MAQISDQPMILVLFGNPRQQVFFGFITSRRFYLQRSSRRASAAFFLWGAQAASL